MVTSAAGHGRFCGTVCILLTIRHAHRASVVKKGKGGGGLTPPAGAQFFCQRLFGDLLFLEVEEHLL